MLNYSVAELRLNFLFIILVVCIVVNYYIVFNEQNMTI